MKNMTPVYVPQPEPSIWAKVKCFFSNHDLDGPTIENDTGKFFCKNKCGSYIFWYRGIPLRGNWYSFGKPHEILIEMEDKLSFKVKGKK